MTRLQEQTANYIKLQTEFDNCEWWEEEEENEKPFKETSQQPVRPPSRPPSRGRTHNLHLNSVNTDHLDLHTAPKLGTVEPKEEMFTPLVHQGGVGSKVKDSPESILRRVERGAEEYGVTTVDDELM